ncbi:MAG: FmdB family zinc ribbon protein [Candidatus Caldatribacteriaceae bacterium]
MPVYEYECLECGKVFEEFQSFSDKPVSQCPFCKGKVKRLISRGVGLVFKGSGFYCTDYRGSSSSKGSSSSCSTCSSSSCSTCGTSSNSKDSESKT